jgi:hypothetical protein
VDDSGEKEYDVVLDALKIHRDKLWKMTNSHIDWGSMDTLRMEQIAKLDEAVQAKAWLSGYDSGKAFAGREWVGLTEDDLRTIYASLCVSGASFNTIALVIEAKLKEKNLTSERSKQLSDNKSAESS